MGANGSLDQFRQRAGEQRPGLMELIGRNPVRISEAQTATCITAAICVHCIEVIPPKTQGARLVRDGPHAASYIVCSQCYDTLIKTYCKGAPAN